MLPTLTEPHVTLRLWGTSDAGALHGVETVRSMAVDLPYTLADARGFIDGQPSEEGIFVLADETGTSPI